MSTLPPLSDAQVRRYLARVGHAGSIAPTLSTLRALHRAHLLAIPYENLDIHFGVPIVLDPEAMFEKLIDRRRGGWCYEMNGVFGRVLETLGFRVHYLAGAVGRAGRGEQAEGNHLVLLVTLGQEWIVDVGFGDGFLTPLPLEPGRYRRGFLRFGVTRAGERWRVDNHRFGGADGFDFMRTPRALDAFAAKCHDLQTSPESGFVRSTVCQRFVGYGLVTLRGATLRDVTRAGVTSRVLRDADEFVQVLADRFDLRLPDAVTLWPKVWASHETWLATTPGAR